MPRLSNSPILFDECKTINLSLLKKWGYMQPGEIKSGDINYKVRGERTGGISFTCFMLDQNPYFRFHYNYNGTPISYEVKLVSLASNLGKGVLWHFKCPKTGKLCRKLYSGGPYFLHRSAFKNAFYENQTYSANYRWYSQAYGVIAKRETAYEQIYRKGFKKYYKGRLTRRHKKLISYIEKSGAISELELEGLIFQDQKRRI